MSKKYMGSDKGLIKLIELIKTRFEQLSCDDLKSVSTEANQGLSDTEKSNARANIGAAASSHTHSYAGSSSAGGSATSAVKLDSSAGSATQPVYFSSGKPVACSYTLGKSVPSDAKFTDTDTWRPLGAGANDACAGNDSRLSNARPASDVYSWAKASSKPTYNGTELKVGGSGTYKDRTVESAISTLNSNFNNSKPQCLYAQGFLMISGRAQGVGNVSGIRFPSNGLSILNFSVKIVAINSTDSFNWGLNFNEICSLLGFSSYSLAGCGNCTIFKSDGTIDGNLTGYSGIVYPNTPHSLFGRIYDCDTTNKTVSEGAWPSSCGITSGQFITGTICMYLN